MNKCSRCGKDMSNEAVILFDSSVSEGEFCEDCHLEDMRQMHAKQKTRSEEV